MLGLAGVAVADSSMGHDEPLNVSATCGTSSATVSWSAVSSSHLVGYDVYKRVAPNGSFARANSATITATQYVVTGLSTGTTYDFGVVSLFDDGQSSVMSALATCTTG